VDGPLDVVVKQFRHERLKDRLRRRFGGSKAAKSWRVAQALGEAGILTPEPVLLIESEDESGPSFFICRHLDGVIEARYLFRAANAGREKEEFPQIDFCRFLEELGLLARRLHEAGILHRDLSVGNVLIHPGDAGTPEALYLIDLNRARLGRRPTIAERAQDLSRLAIFRPEHQELFLTSYQGGPPSSTLRTLYLARHHGFLWKNRSKRFVRGAIGKAHKLLLPRVAHPHIPQAPAGAGVRDQVVWDHLSDQPHQHAGRLAKLRVRLADARHHAEEAAVVAAALPRIRSRYRELKAGLYRQPVNWDGVGLCVRPWPEDSADPAAVAGLVEELGVRHVLLRLHPWAEDHAAEEALARELHRLQGRGCELTYALPQNRELVKDPVRWRRAIEEMAPRFLPYGRRFQVGQAINRSKWGIWNLAEYVELVRGASEVLRRQPDVEILGPAVIDFEFHVTAAALNLRRPGLRFDAVSSLLYVDRRGAPENRQAGFDTVDKVVLLKAIADTARNSTGRTWITEVNWPLREGPHSPAGRAVSVDEEPQADYLVRYYLLALGTGLVERVFWWQLVARGYGLVDPLDGELRRRPAFFAFKTLLRELDGCRLEAVLTAPAPARLYRFRRPDGRDLIVAWSAAGTTRAALPRPAVAAVGRDGQELPVPSGIEVDLGSSPVYFLL
jgi:tRNA A-37 threonylcarbamoyl transferase component Bud32